MKQLQLSDHWPAHIVCIVHYRQSCPSDYWLPVHNRITFKVATLCFKACHFRQSFYWSLVLLPFNSGHYLCSSSLKLFLKLRVKTKICCRRLSDNPIQSNEIWRIQAQGLYVHIWTKLYAFIHTLTIYNLASNSENVSMPIKFNFLINQESIQLILKYVSRLCINNNVRKTIPYCDNSITKEMFT